jgi:hypothetical protein
VTPYLYRCPVHGEIEVRKPMAEASRPEYCTECFLDGQVGQELRRVYEQEPRTKQRRPATPCDSGVEVQRAARRARPATRG